MRFEVPQFIEVEDKIIGPFTWKQFVYLAGGAGLIVILFFTLPFLIFAIFAVPIGGLAGFLAFHKVNNRPFSIFLESFVHYFSNSKLYLWRKADQQTIVAREPKPIAPAFIQAPEVQKKSIASLSRKLELNTLQK